MGVADDDAPAGETVLNIVDAHQLNELTLDKKALMGVIKALMKRTVGWMKENGKSDDEVKAFQKGATELVKFVIGKFDEMQVSVENHSTLKLPSASAGPEMAKKTQHSCTCH